LQHLISGPPEAKGERFVKRKNSKKRCPGGGGLRGSEKKRFSKISSMPGDIRGKRWGGGGLREEKRSKKGCFCSQSYTVGTVKPGLYKLPGGVWKREGRRGNPGRSTNAKVKTVAKNISLGFALGWRGPAVKRNKKDRGWVLKDVTVKLQAMGRPPRIEKKRKAQKLRKQKGLRGGCRGEGNVQFAQRTERYLCKRLIPSRQVCSKGVEAGGVRKRRKFRKGGSSRSTKTPCPGLKKGEEKWGGGGVEKEDLVGHRKKEQKGPPSNKPDQG